MTTPSVPHRFEVEFTVPGTPERVWEAIATADGISGWMMPTELEERAGGALTFHMGPTESVGKVTAYEAPRRLEYEEDWASLVGQSGEGVTPLVTEFIVEAKSGGTCVVRVVTSAFGQGDDWESEFFDEMSIGWGPMLDNLRVYLTHFAGQRVTPLNATASAGDVSPVDTMTRVREALEVTSAGDAVTTLGIVGTVERTNDRTLAVRVEKPVTGLLSIATFDDGTGGVAQLMGYLFGDDAADYVTENEPAWQQWLEAAARR